MTTLAKRRGKINGFIAEYKKRIKAYRQKYGYKNRIKNLQIEGCKLKIEAWEKELERLAKRYDPIKDMMKAIRFTTTWFGDNPAGAIRRAGDKGSIQNGYGVENNKSKFFLAKFSIENGLLPTGRGRGDSTQETTLLGITHSACIERRAKAIVAMRKSKALSAEYRLFEKALQEFLVQKPKPTFLDGKATQPTEAVSSELCS